MADALLVHLAREGEQADLSGPRVLLRPKAAEIVALAPHELTANAVEHGALTLKHGHVRVAWQVTPEAGGPKLDFAWVETGLSGLPSDPGRRGFGTETIERTLRYELGAETILTYPPGGLSCTVRCPLL